MCILNKEELDKLEKEIDEIIDETGIPNYASFDGNDYDGMSWEENISYDICDSLQEDIEDKVIKAFNDIDELILKNWQNKKEINIEKLNYHVSKTNFKKMLETTNNVDLKKQFEDFLDDYNMDIRYDIQDEMKIIWKEKILEKSKEQEKEIDLFNVLIEKYIKWFQHWLMIALKNTEIDDEEELEAIREEIENLESFNFYENINSLLEYLNFGDMKNILRGALNDMDNVEAVAERMYDLRNYDDYPNIRIGDMVDDIADSMKSDLLLKFEAIIDN